jgi:hypothetical protein
MDEVRSGGSFISQNDLRLQFGIRKAKSADVVLHWPDGTVQDIGAVAADHLLTIQEGKGLVRNEPLAIRK